MTTREKYKQAFSVLKSSDDITLEELMMKKEKQRMKKLKNIRIAAACFVFLFVCTNGIAYAATGSTWISEILHFTTGNGSEVEMIQNENSLSFSIQREEEKNRDYVSVENGRLYFVLDEKKEDVTEACSEKNYYKYEYTDDQQMRHVILIGGTPADAGWAELMFDKDGNYVFNQMNVNGTTDPVWLLEGMHDQGVPTGNPEYDEGFLN